MSVVVALILTFLGQPCVAMELASSRNEINRGLVRRQTAIHMEPNGELVQDMNSEMFSNKKKGFDKCRDAFEYGALDQNACAHNGSKLIIDMTVCSEAAKEMNAGLEPSKEKIPWNYFDNYPQGCFHAPCPESKSGCFFYNPDGDAPKIPKGFPVCSKPRFMYGQEGSDQCPDAYEAMSRDACQGAAECLGDEVESDFEIQPEDQDKYVAGCSMHNVTGFLRVHWNPPADYYTTLVNTSGLLQTAPEDVEAQHDKADETISATDEGKDKGKDKGKGKGKGKGKATTMTASGKVGVVICRAPNMTLSDDRDVSKL